jgi:hypothetical protein
VDVHTYEQSQDTLALLQILAHGKKQIEAGHTVPLSEAIGSLRASLKATRALKGKGENHPEA